MELQNRQTHPATAPQAEVAAAPIQMSPDAAVAQALQSQELLGPVQLDGTPRVGPQSVQALAAQGIQGSSTTLPHLAAIQQSFGRHEVAGVQAHVGGTGGAAAEAMGAEAFATGNHVAFQDSPDLHTAAHEAAHVVQQRGGVQLKGGVGEVGDTYERHADAVADAVVQGKSAESLLDPFAGGGGQAAVQRQEAAPAPSLGAGLHPALQAAVDAALAEGASEAEVQALLTELGHTVQGGGDPAGPAAEAPVQARLASGVSALGPQTTSGHEAPVQLSPTQGGAVQQTPGRGPGTHLTLPGVGTISGWKVRVIQAAAVAAGGPIGALFAAAVEAANRLNVTVGIGPAVAAGLGVGIGGSAGIVIAPGGVLGVYGSLSGACGAVFSASATLAVTVVRGGIDAFGGECVAFTVAGGEVVVGGLSILATMSGSFLGVCVQVGVGVGSPFEVFVQYQRTWTAGGQ